MDKEQAVKITQKFLSKLPSEIDIQKVVLYGSWVYGHPREDSDIDIAVIVSELRSDYLNLLTDLYYLASAVDLRIEPVLFEENNDESGFLNHILSHGKIIYDKNQLVNQNHAQLL